MQTHPGSLGLLAMMTLGFQDYCILEVREGCKKMGMLSVNPTPSSKTILKGSHPKQVLKISTQEMAPFALNRKQVIQL